MDTLWHLAFPHKGLYLASIFTSILSVAAGFAPYIAVSAIAASLISGSHDLNQYLCWCGVAAAGHLLKSVLAGLSTALSHKATFAVLSELRRALAAKLHRVPLGAVTSTPTGALKSPFVERAEQIEVPLAHIVPELTANLLVPLGIIVYIFILDWRMGFAALATIPLGLAAYGLGMRSYARTYADVVTAKTT